MKKLITPFFIFLISLSIHAQTSNDLLNLLVSNGSITKEQADSLKAAENKTKKPFFAETANRVKISGYTQLRYRQFDEKGKIDGFDIRRARVDIKGSISPRWNYRLQTDFANSPKLLDAYGEFKINDYFNITLGQTKIPFSLENLTSSAMLELIDRSQVVEALVARTKDINGSHSGRDIGIQLGGSIVKLHDRSFIDYKVGIIFNKYL